MLHLRDYPIAKQLTWLNLLVTTVALLQSCSAFLVYDVISSRNALVRNVSMQAQIIGSIIIRIAREAHEGSLEVKDHGRGMAKRGAGAEPEVGVQGMQERARQHGALLRCALAVNGTSVIAVLPLAGEEAA